MEDDRNRAFDAKHKNSLTTVATEAELFYDDNTSYQGVCKSDRVEQITIEISDLVDLACNDSANAYAVSVGLNAGGYFCVDSSGAREELSEPLGTATSCQ